VCHGRTSRCAVAGLQLSNLAQPHIIEIAKSPSGQPAIVGLDDGQGNGPDLSAVVQESARLALLLGDQSAADPFFDFSGKPISHLSVAFGGGRLCGSEPAGSHAGEAAFPTRTQDGSESASLRPVLDYPLKLARVLRDEALRER
jgi:hypothetical protein